MTGINGRSRKGFVSYFCLRESPKQKVHVPRHRISALHRKQIQIAQLCCLLGKIKKEERKAPPPVPHQAHELSGILQGSS